MFRNSWLNTVAVPLVVLVAVLTLATHRADAQVKPFKVTGGGLAPDGVSLVGAASPHWAVGVATELGKYYGEGFFQITGPGPDPMNPLQASFSSAPDFTFVAANGDKLVFTYGDVDNGADENGLVTLTPHDGGTFTAVFVAEFNPVVAKCTGRFADVTDGSFIMTAVSAPFTINNMTGTTSPFAYTWQGEGTLTFAGAGE
jgi:hypothetical protein